MDTQTINDQAELALPVEQLPQHNHDDQIARLRARRAVRQRDPHEESIIRELAKIRTCLKSGSHEEGRERLECVLGDLDSAWRTFC